MNSSPSAVTAAHLPSLVPAPERGVWRLGKKNHPREYNRLEPETSQGSSAGRFSLATYGMLYCASDPAGCYAGRSRPSASTRSCAASSATSGTSGPAT